MRKTCASKVCPLGILMSSGGLSECNSLVLPQLTQYIVVSHCFLGDLDIFMEWARGPFEDTTFKTIHAINYPSCRETFLHVRKFDHLWYIASDQYNSEINEIMP